MDIPQKEMIKLEIYEEVKSMNKPDIIEELVNYKYHIDYQDYKIEDKNVLIDKYFKDLKKKSRKEVVKELGDYRWAIHLISYNQLVKNLKTNGELDESKFNFDNENNTFTLKETSGLQTVCNQ